MNWYYAKADNRIGPMPLEGLVRAAQSGTLQTTDLVWSDGMPDWVVADAVPDLFSDAVPHPLLHRVHGAEYLRQFPTARGRYLAVTSGTVLPMRCIKTNVPVSDHEMVRKEFYWLHPAWVLTVFLGLLVYIVLYYALRKKCLLTYGLATKVHRKYQIILLIKVLLTIGLFIAIPFSTMTNSTSLIATIVVLFIVSLIATFVGNSPLVAKKFGNDQFLLKGCGPEFLATLGADQLLAT